MNLIDLLFLYSVALVVAMWYAVCVFHNRFAAMREQVVETCLRTDRAQEWARFECLVRSETTKIVYFALAPIAVPAAHFLLWRHERRFGVR